MSKLLSVALLALPMPALADNALNLGIGFDYSTGKYGQTTSTDILYVPVTAKYEMDQLILKLVVPYISITGPSGVIPGLGATGPGNSSTTPAAAKVPPGQVSQSSSQTVSNAGLGDVVASADYEFYAEDSLMLNLVSKVKFGTADASKNLGTGQNDYSIQLDIGYQLPSKTFLFATIGYKLVGAPTGVSVNNVAYGALGFSTKLTDTSSAGMTLNYAQAALVGGSNVTDITLFASNKLSRDTKVQVTLLKGLADGSPDLGIGASISEYF